jgi:uncharacterized membrane protein YkvA (DUF1232 family)
MGIIGKLKINARKLKKEITVIYYAYQHPKMTIWPKMVIAFTLGYALSPVDLIPDFIPVLGYLDDLFIVPALLVLSIKLIPTDVLEESRKIANQKPIILKKNRLFSFIFIVIWIIILVIILLSFLKYF